MSETKEPKIEVDNQKKEENLENKQEEKSKDEENKDLDVPKVETEVEEKKEEKEVKEQVKEEDTKVEVTNDVDKKVEVSEEATETPKDAEIEQKEEQTKEDEGEKADKTLEDKKPPPKVPKVNLHVKKFNATSKSKPYTLRNALNRGSMSFQSGDDGKVTLRSYKKKRKSPVPVEKDSETPVLDKLEIEDDTKEAPSTKKPVDEAAETKADPSESKATEAKVEKPAVIKELPEDLRNRPDAKDLEPEKSEPRKEQFPFNGKWESTEVELDAFMSELHLSKKFSKLAINFGGDVTQTLRIKQTGKNGEVFVLKENNERKVTKYNIIVGKSFSYENEGGVKLDCKAKWGENHLEFIVEETNSKTGEVTVITRTVDIKKKTLLETRKAGDLKPALRTYHRAKPKPKKKKKDNPSTEKPKSD